jgi:uncharacterized protein YfaP (DUF2135 family)
LNEGEIRVILTWKENPEDLDSHLLGPRPDGSQFHVYFDSKEASDGATLMASLDLDDTNSYGPETITVYNALDGGVYTYFVHDYTNGENSNNPNSLALGSSGAKVLVYMGSSLVKEYNVPPGLLGTVWEVFEYEGGEFRSLQN